MIDLRLLTNPANDWLGENKSSLFRFCVVAGVLLAAAIIAPRALTGNRYATLLFFSYLGVVIVIVFSRWPALGLASILFAAFLIPYSGPGGFNASEAAVGLVLAVWIFGIVAERQKIQLVYSRATRPLLIFMLIAVLALGVGQLSWYPCARNAPMDAQLGGFAVFVLSAGLFLLVAHQINDLRSLKRITWFFIILSGLYIAARLIGRPGDFITSLYHVGVRRGSMFWTWLVVLTMSQAIFNQNLDRRWRIALAGLVVATLYEAYFQWGDWKSGWIPPLFGMAFILVLRFWRQARYLTPVAIIPAWYVVSQAIASEQYSWGTRVDAWLIVTEIVKISPILGLGFANYYWYAPLFPIRGWYVNFNSHSQYVDIYAQTGLLGLACFLWFFWQVGMLGWRLRERVPEGFARAYVYGALGGLVGTFVAGFLVDWILPFVYNVGLNGFRASLVAWIFLGGLVSVEKIVRNQEMSQSINKIVRGGQFDG